MASLRRSCFFDFIGTASTAEVIQETRELICILCNKSKTIHLFIPIEKDLFITLCHDGKIFKWIKAHLPTTQAPPPPQLFNGNSITSRTKPLSIRRNFYPRYHDRELDKIFGIVTPRQKFPKRRKRQSPPTKRKRRP